MFAEYLFVITDSLHGRSSRNERISDRLLEDIGLTRAEFTRQMRPFTRKPSR